MYVHNIIQNFESTKNIRIIKIINLTLYTFLYLGSNIYIYNSNIPTYAY